MKWNDNLPNPDDWQPDKKNAITLQKAFLEKCKHIEQLIKLRSRIEAEMDINNFDAGPGIEDIIREEFEKILPKRYKITKGVVNDKNGFTVGDCDFIIMNDTWFPAMKEGATKSSRRYHFPIEAVYSVIEIKKTITLKSLDEAMEKLVCCKRLERNKTYEWKITENSSRDNKTENAIRNELFTGIIATKIGKGLSKEEIFNRFFEISKNIPFTERINSISILGFGTLTWGFKDTERGWKNSVFTVPIYSKDIKDMQLYEYILNEEGHTLLFFIKNLLTQLHFSVLDPYLVWSKYSGFNEIYLKKFKIIRNTKLK